VAETKRHQQSYSYKI